MLVTPLKKQIIPKKKCNIMVLLKSYQCEDLRNVVIQLDSCFSQLFLWLRAILFPSIFVLIQYIKRTWWVNGGGHLCSSSRSLFIYSFCVLPYTACFLTNLFIPVTIKQLIVTKKRHTSPYATFITKKGRYIENFELDCCDLFSLQFSMSVDLFSDHVEHI